MPETLEVNAVLGHDSSYVKLAARIHDARYFHISKTQWNSMSQARRWSENEQFLDRSIKAKDRFCFSVDPALARRGSYYTQELRYLHSRGVQVVPPLEAYIAP